MNSPDRSKRPSAMPHKMCDRAYNHSMETRKIVINDCHGGYSLSQATIDRLRELGEEFALSDEMGECELNGAFYIYDEISRDNPLLIKVVEELGGEDAGEYIRP